MIRSIRTYSDAYLQRHKATHARHPAFGTHRHPYLLATVREVAARVAATLGAPPNLLDYGCGKGSFLDEMAALGVFGDCGGYDPAMAQFRNRPARAADVVLCLDVLDQVEDRFVEAVIADVAQFTGHAAVFTVITKQTAARAFLRPRSAIAWQQLIGAALLVTSTAIRAAEPQELAQGAAPERVVIVAAPPQ